MQKSPEQSSETESVRRKMCEAIDAKIREAGAVPEQTTIYCAYKQGYSWLAEEMLPRLKEAGANNSFLFQTVSSRRPDGME